MRDWIRYFRWRAQMHIIDHQDWVEFIDMQDEVLRNTYLYQQQKLARLMHLIYWQTIYRLLGGK